MPTRRSVLRTAVLAGGVAATGWGAAAPAASAASAATAATSAATAAGGNIRDRAVASYEAMQRHLYVPDGTGLYRERVPAVQDGENPYSYEWPFSQAHVATLDLTAVPGRTGPEFVDDLADRGVGQERYWNPAGGTTGLPGYDSYVRPPLGNGGDMFYDDNAWVGLAKVQQHLFTGDAAALGRAREIFDLLVSGWDTDPTHPFPGGVFWTQAPWSRDRNTVSTMPSAQLGLRLHQITGEPGFLDWAVRMYEWTNRHLLAPNGLYWDHVDLEGRIEKSQWSYNQGVPIGVNVLFHQVTGDSGYLDRAVALAATAHRHYVVERRLHGQPAFFNSIFFKNLLLLESVTGDRTARRAMREYADTVWRLQRDPGTGLYHLAEGRGGTILLDQAALTQIYAVLSWDPADLGKLY
jgi:hypothetical protein